MVMPILEEVADLPDTEALIIPLNVVKLPATTLRSAIVKAASSRGLKVATYSDESSLYVWRKTTGTRRYERTTKRGAKGK